MKSALSLPKKGRLEPLEELMFEMMPEQYIIKNYLMNWNKWFEIEKDHFKKDSSDLKYNEEMNYYQDQYEEALIRIVNK